MTRRGPSTRSLLWWLVFTITSALSGHSPKPGDSRLMCLAAQSLLRDGSLAIDPVRIDVTRGPNGSFYTKYPLLCVVQCVPALLLQHAARRIAPDDAALELWAVALLAHALTATLALGLLSVALALGASERTGVWLALIVVFSTPLVISGRVLYSESLQAVLAVHITLAALRARDARRVAPFIWGGLLCGLAINTKILWLSLPFAILVDQLHERLTRQRLLKLAGLALPGMLLGVGLFLTYNKLRYGEYLAQGYDSERDGTIGFAVPMASGLYGLLLSSGKSLFAYAPVLLVSVVAVPRWWRTRRRDLWLLAIPTLFTICVTARWWAWSGDWAWGPRLLIPIIPLAALPTIDALSRRSRWLSTLAACGLIVQSLAITIDVGHFLQIAHGTGQVWASKQASSELRDDMLPLHFVPELSPITGQAWLFSRYLTQPGWDHDSPYPWKSLGIKSWRPHANPTPPRLDFWLDASASRTAWALELTLVAASIALAVLLTRRLRAQLA